MCLGHCVLCCRFQRAAQFSSGSVCAGLYYVDPTGHWTLCHQEGLYTDVLLLQICFLMTEHNVICHIDTSTGEQTE